MTKRRLQVALAVLALGLVGCDHVTKYAARSALGDGHAATLVPGVLDLRYTENRDTAFSLFRTFGLPSPPGGVIAALQLAMLAAVVIAWWRRRRVARWPELLAFALLVAGAAGNALDRLVRGYVINFIHLRCWPVFNVADMALVAGIALLVLSLRPSPGRASPAPPGG